MEEEEYVSHPERERNPLAERFRKGLLAEGSFGAEIPKKAAVCERQCCD